jgi:hypothetical protein
VKPEIARGSNISNAKGKDAQKVLLSNSRKGRNAAQKLTAKSVASAHARSLTKASNQQKGEAGGSKRIPMKLRPQKK